MRTDDLLLLLDYNTWANDRVAAAAARAGAEILVAKTTAQSYGSLRGTLLHVVDGEYAWRTLFETGAPPAQELAEADHPTLEDIEARRRQEEAALRRFAGTLGDADLDGILRYTIETGERRERVLWHCLVHLVNHGTHHRGQASATLREHGHTVAELDLSVFLIERGLSRTRPPASSS
jgi:uncharacterized damage-inducible protein DinB